MTHDIGVGIDLGTTYSAVAYVNATGRSEIVRNSLHDTLTPSAVYFDDRRVLVGNEARKRGLFAVDRFADCVKREMGSPVYPHRIRGRFLPPEFIQSFILRQLKEDLERVISTKYRVVVTVPAFFDEPRRNATVDTAELAGLDVVDVVNEPTAAAISHGEELGYLNGVNGPQNPETVLVYDLGGGTFDATIVEFRSSTITTLSTDGDVRLGGRDWDQRLADYCAEKFVAQFREDPRDNAMSLQRLLMEVEEAKRTLSVRLRASVTVHHAGCTLELGIDRELFESLTSDLLARTSLTVTNVLRNAGLGWRDLTRVILCGGATRMPQVHSMVEHISGRAPGRLANPDEAVARGAALYCDHRLRQGASKFRVRDVNSHSLGILGVDPETGRKRNAILIPRNTPLPATKTRKFVTRSSGQSSVIVSVLEGEAVNPDGCTMLGRTVISDLPSSLPAGWPVTVTYTYTEGGRLSASAEIPGTDRQATIEFQRAHGLTGPQLARWKCVADADSDLFEQILDEALCSIESQPDAAIAPDYLKETDPSLNSDTTIAAPETTHPLPLEPESSLTTVSRSGSSWVPTIVVLCGHLIFSVAGLVIGYLLLCWINPELNFLEIDLPWE